MAKAYKAITRIQGGRMNKNQEPETFEFQPGDVVTGLTKDEMKQLWEAGALDQVDVVEVEKVSEPAPTPVKAAE